MFMRDSFQLVGSGDLGGLALSDFVARLGLPDTASGTYRRDPRGEPAAAWRLWREGWFAPLLAPAFARAWRGAGSQRLEEILAAALRLDAGLSETLRRRSLASAGDFLETRRGMRCGGAAGRYTERVAAGAAPGHVTVLFAVQAAERHLPLASSLAAYAWFEFRTGHPAATPPSPEDFAQFESVLPQLAVALGGKSAENGAEREFLRAI